MTTRRTNMDTRGQLVRIAFEKLGGGEARKKQPLTQAGAAC
jgi:hypothetical protein